MIKKEQNKAITLVALVITIIILLILSGVTIASLSGENGIITNAIKAKKMTTLSQCKEEYEMFITEEMIKNNKFQKTSLAAGETNLIYNTQKPDETGNIYTIMPSLKNNEYSQKLEIIKGDLLLNTKDPKEIELAKSIGIKPNPYDIVNGELLSSNGNLLLMDETGTLTIPNSVTSIGEGAFADLPGLKTIIIPGTVKTIKQNAFRNNPTLKKVIMQDGVESIGFRAFDSCTNLNEIYTPNSLTSISNEAFIGCYNLKKVTLSENITTLNNYLFAGCSNLETINIPKSLKKIGSYTFEHCQKINNITFPKTLSEIGHNAFLNCSNLTNIILNDNEHFTYSNGFLIDNLYNNIIYIADANIKDKTYFEIPNNVTTFNTSITNYNNITKLIIPTSLQKIDIECLPSSINNIEIKGINNNFIIDNSSNILYDANKETLLLCFNKNEIINITENIKSIGNFAFKCSTNLKELTLPNSVESIGNYAFHGFINDNSTIKIGANVNKIGRIYRDYTSNVKYNFIIDPMNNFFSVEDYILYNKDKTEIKATLKRLNGIYTIKNTVQKIDSFAFSYQYSLKKIILPNNLKEIGYNAFVFSHFESINIPNSVKIIGNNAFAQIENLMEIIVDNKKDSIPGAPWGATRGNRIIKWNE